MKLPIKCPYCGDILSTEFSATPGISITNACAKRVTHAFHFHGDEQTNEVTMISIRLNNSPLTYARWDYTAKVLSIYKIGDPTRTFLPFFEPNLSDYHVLISKIKGYLVFS